MIERKKGDTIPENSTFWFKSANFRRQERSPMRSFLFLSIFLVACIAQQRAVSAQETRTVKFESKYGKTFKGATCLLTTGGKTFEITTPSRVKIPLDEDGKLGVESLLCKYQTFKRTTKFFPNENEFGSEIFGVTVDFKSTMAEFWFKKKNGGVALFTKGSQIIQVR